MREVELLVVFVPFIEREVDDPGQFKTITVCEVQLIAGAVEHARASGAPAVEAYPVDNAGERVDLTMAYVGTRHMFEDAGFTLASPTTSVLNGFPRVLMRLDLR